MGSHIDDKPYGFVLDAGPKTEPGRHILYFDALDEEMLNAWLEAIHSAISPQLEKTAQAAGPTACRIDLQRRCDNIRDLAIVRFAEELVQREEAEKEQERQREEA